MRLGGSSGRIKRSSYISDDDMGVYHSDFKYPSTLFKVTKIDREGKEDEAVTNTITANFLKEFLVEPLVEQANKAPNTFQIFFKPKNDCSLHQEYIAFLKEKEQQRIEAENLRK